ncbi:hypothetical protein [Streptomyces sp. NBC_01304]|uniref:hypothetical protein n=1 Tax=Streptomyces sp. NBC_01304 TaxID=2903818 RepID=UPI002E1589B0|nr:hypothetical protein OG430_41510 [Streptomyces sp. NBC_01304]
MTRTTTQPPIPAPPPSDEVCALHAERMRAQLAEIWGKPVRKLPRGMDLLQTMYNTTSSQDLTEARIPYFLNLCARNAAAYRTPETLVAPHSMGQRLINHPFLSGAPIHATNLEATALVPDGLVYFPTPIQLDDLHPLYGLAWHMTGSGRDLTLDIETVTTTQLIPTRLPPLLAATTKLPRTLYCPNSVVTLHQHILSRHSNPAPFGAPDPAAVLALLLAFWDLRPPTPAPDTADDAGEHLVHVPNLTTPDHNTPPRGRQNKGATPTPPKRAIRIIHEPAHTPATSPHPTATDSTGAKWKEDTLRWEVGERWQNRCPNPHQHRAIIEAGGECTPVLVRVKPHTNGPRGRATDSRRTVRIIPDRT